MPATATAAAAVTVAATANSDADVTSPGKGGIDGITGGGELLVMGAIYRDGTSGGISGWSDYRVHRSADGGLHWELVCVIFGAISDRDPPLLCAPSSYRTRSEGLHASYRYHVGHEPVLLLISLFVEPRCVPSQNDLLRPKITYSSQGGGLLGVGELLRNGGTQRHARRGDDRHRNRTRHVDGVRRGHPVCRGLRQVLTDEDGPRRLTSTESKI